MERALRLAEVATGAEWRASLYDSLAYHDSEVYMKALVLVLAILIFLVSAVAARSMAARRGLNPVFWAALGFAFGPLVFPVLVLVRRRVYP